MKAKKKLKEYLTRGVRRLKHRKGFGVHSPFAYSVITEVIEEKAPYYAYQRMRRMYAGGRRTPRQAPMPFKAACLLLRLANRFRVRRVLEVGCDGGYTLLPLLLVDSRNELYAIATEAAQCTFGQNFAWVGERDQARVAFAARPDDVPQELVADLIAINDLPDGMDEDAQMAYLEGRMHERTVLWVRGIRPGQRLESLWDRLCDRDDIAITMDLYDYGLAIRKPRFYKQHYIVSF